jgi:ATP-dependent Clp protease ATP-binding subunit ClpB
VDFKNTVVILTSNVGSTELAALEERRDLGDDDKANKMRDTAMNALRGVFRPEFINRLDEIVVFRRLGRDEIRRIVDIQLLHLGQRLARRDLKLEVADAAKDLLGEVGWDPQYGARPLKRAIQRHLEDTLARRVLEGQFQPGDTIHVERRGSELEITKRSAPAEAAHPAARA